MFFFWEGLVEKNSSVINSWAIRVSLLDHQNSESWMDILGSLSCCYSIKSRHFGRNIMVLDNGRESVNRGDQETVYVVDGNCLCSIIIRYPSIMIWLHHRHGHALFKLTTT